MSADELELPAGGQTLRLPGASRDAALHDQLYRYAQDMQELLRNQNELEQRYRALRESYESIAEGGKVIEGLIHSSRDIYLMTDRAGTILQCNPSAGAIAPVPRLLGVCLGDLLAPSHLEGFRLLIERLEGGGAAPAEELELHIRRQGSETELLIVAAGVMPARVGGDLRGIHWMLRDVTRVREAEFESEISSLVISNATEGVIITDCGGNILAVNPAFTRITGYSAEEAVGRNPRFLKSGLHDKSFYDQMWRAMRTEGRWQGQVTNRKKSGETYVEWMALTCAQDSEGRVLSYVCVFSDLSLLVQAERRLFHLTHHDALTQLPNRELLQDRLRQMIGLARRRGESFALMCVDIDRFTQINKTLGHPVGDMALREVASRLAESIRTVDTVARLGGDQFVILAPGLGRESDIALVVDKIVNALLVPMSIDGHDFNIGASIGCALYPDHGEDEDTLLRHADIAIGQARRSGGNAYAMFRPAEKPADGAVPGGGSGE